MSNTSDLAACPFCGRDVDADLVTYGGKCPHCFGEIPGEEAPTDPGEEKKAAELKVHAAQVQRARRAPLVLAGFLLLGVVGATGFALFTALVPRDMPVLNLDDSEYDMGEFATLVAYEAPKTTTVDGNPKSDTGSPKAPKSDGTKVEAPFAGVGSKLLGEDGAIPTTATDPGTAKAPGESGPRKVASTGPLEPQGLGSNEPTASSGTGTPSLDVGVEIRRREQQGVKLMDDNQIVDMIKYVLTAELPKLRSCYESRLKQNDALAGRWTLEFTVTEAGKVSGAVATGQDMQDAELES